ncbi:MAG TPA: PQQ-binding-like beta-propeller repeat protein [bacterium]|nr:PQQ-binding-like beta-propeller repeat protein [bacterium]
MLKNLRMIAMFLIILVMGLHCYNCLTGERIVRESRNIPRKHFTIAVVDFDTVADDEEKSNWIGYGISESLSEKLAGAGFGRLRVYDRRDLSHITRGTEPTGEIAGLLGNENIDYFITGTIRMHGAWNHKGTSVEISCHIVDTNDGTIYENDVIKKSGVVGNGEELNSMLADIAKEIASFRLFGNKSYDADYPVKIETAPFNDLMTFKYGAAALMALDSRNSKLGLENIQKALRIDPGYTGGHIIRNSLYKMHYEETAGTSKKEAGEKWEAAARADAESPDIDVADYNLASALISRCRGEGIKDKCEEGLNVIDRFTELNRNKDFLWRYATDGYIKGKPALLNNELVFNVCKYYEISGYPGYPQYNCKYVSLTAVDKDTGKENWTNDLSNDTLDSPHIINDTIYLSTCYPGISGYDDCSKGLVEAVSRHDNWDSTSWSYINEMESLLRIQDVSDNVVIADNSNWIVAIDALTGKEIWKYIDGGDISIIDGDRVFNGGKKEKIRALDRLTGKKLWVSKNKKKHLDSFIVHDGNVFITEDNGSLYKLDGNSGEVLWRSRLECDYLSPPLVFHEEVLVMSDSGILYAINIETGKTTWSVDFDFERHSNLVISQENIFVIGDIVYLIDREHRNIRQTFNIDSNIVDSVVSSGKTAAIATKNNRIHFFDIDSGKKLWSKSLKNITGKELSLSEFGGKIFANADDLYLLNIDRTFEGISEPESLLLKSEALAELGKEKEAVELLEDLSKKSPELYEINYALAILCDRIQNKTCAAKASGDFLSVIKKGKKARRISDIWSDNSQLSWRCFPGRRPDKSAMPFVSGDKVFVNTIDGRIHVLDMEYGNTLDVFNPGDSCDFPETPKGKDIFAGYDYAHSHVYAYDRETGKLIRSVKVNDNGFAGIPQTTGDSVIAGFSDGHVMSIDAYTGETKWTHSGTKPLVWGPLYSDGLVLFASHLNGLHVLDATTGNRIWVFKSGDPESNEPVINGDIVYLTGDSTIYALDKKTGSQIWESNLPGNKVFSTGNEIVSNTFVIWTGILYGIDAGTGENKWKLKNIYIDPEHVRPVTHNGMLFMKSEYGQFLRVDPDNGKRIWSLNTHGAIGSNIASYGNLILVPAGNKLYAVNADSGKKEWELEIVELIHTIEVSRDGILVMGGDTGTVYAMDLDQTGD